MFTAKDMYNKLKVVDVCQGIDGWIETKLFQQFVIQRSDKVLVKRSDIINQGWKGEDFYLSMKERGFTIVYACDETPLTEVYYEIIISPQGR